MNLAALEHDLFAFCSHFNLKLYDWQQQAFGTVASEWMGVSATGWAAVSWPSTSAARLPCRRHSGPHEVDPPGSSETEYLDQRQKIEESLTEEEWKQSVSHPER
jgi:hypothetical protein